MSKKTATDDLLALICKAMSEGFGGDPSSPGVLIAHLPEGRGGCARLTTDAEGFGVQTGPDPFPTYPGELRGTPVFHEPGLDYDAPCFYVVAQRFHAPRGGLRVNEAKAFAADLDTAVAAVAKMMAWPVRHQAELAKAVSK